jgi:hypothetical protein
MSVTLSSSTIAAINELAGSDTPRSRIVEKAVLEYVARRRARRTRFDPVAHVRWLRKFWKGRRVGISTDVLLERDRAE